MRVLRGAGDAEAGGRGGREGRAGERAAGNVPVFRVRACPVPGRITGVQRDAVVTACGGNCRAIVFMNSKGAPRIASHSPLQVEGDGAAQGRHVYDARAVAQVQVLHVAQARHVRDGGARPEAYSNSTTVFQRPRSTSSSLRSCSTRQHVWKASGTKGPPGTCGPHRPWCTPP